jgi:predicted membrane-bound dolichyl-phosphate-mannose-protein mannosyltransferase
VKSALVLVAIVGLIAPAAQAQTRNNCTTICNSSGQCTTRCGFGYSEELHPQIHHWLNSQEPPKRVEAMAVGYVICPFGPPCWRDGRRCLDGALCRRLADD